MFKQLLQKFEQWYFFSWIRDKLNYIQSEEKNELVLPHIFIVMQMKFVECTIVQQLSWLVEQEKSVCNWLHCMLVHFSWRLWCITIWPLQILPVIFNQCLYIYICFKTKPNYWSPVLTIIAVDSRFKSCFFFKKSEY